MKHMQRNNAKDDAVEGGEDGERPPSSQPIAPAVAGQSPPQLAGKSIPKYARPWRAYFEGAGGRAARSEVSPTIRCFSTRPTGDGDYAYDLATRSYIRGEHLALGAGDTVTVERMRPDETEWSPVGGVTPNAAESTDAQIVLDYTDTIGGIETKLRATVVIGGKTAVSNEVVVTDVE